MKVFVVAIFAISALGPSANAWSMGSFFDDTRLWEPLSPLARPQGDSERKEPWIVREQDIGFSSTVLSVLRNSNEPLPDRLLINLGDEQNVKVHFTHRTSSRTGSTVFQGTIETSPPGDILLSVQGEAVAGIVRKGDATWRITYRGSGRHRLMQIDVEKLPPD